MSTDASVQVPTQEELTRNQIYYARHREEKRAKVKERYHNRPDVVEKRAERERRKEEREAKLAEKRLERERKLEERNRQLLALIEKKKEEKARI